MVGSEAETRCNMLPLEWTGIRGDKWHNSRGGGCLVTFVIYTRWCTQHKSGADAICTYARPYNGHRKGTIFPVCAYCNNNHSVALLQNEHAIPCHKRHLNSGWLCARIMLIALLTVKMMGTSPLAYSSASWNIILWFAMILPISAL